MFIASGEARLRLSIPLFELVSQLEALFPWTVGQWADLEDLGMADAELASGAGTWPVRQIKTRDGLMWVMLEPSRRFERLQISRRSHEPLPQSGGDRPLPAAQAPGQTPS